jgi:hypothetical protein
MATGSPGTNGVWQYGEDDSEATFSALLNKAASTTDTAIGLDRGRLTTLEARKLSGLVPVIAPTVNYSGGTAVSNSNGEVTFTGVTSISLNSVFTSAFTNYKIIISKGLVASISNQEISFRLRSAGTNRTTLYYFNGVLQLGSNAPSASQTQNTDRWTIGNLSSANINAATLEIYNPAVAAAKTNFLNTFYGFSGSTFYLSSAGVHDVAQSHDGFTLTMGTGNMSGSIAVYGYNI